jgi:hypothetical protein
VATRKQKQELIKALKFAPRDIVITLSGYGGEIVMGRISEAAYDYWRDRDDLSDFVMDWDGDFENVPDDAKFVTDGDWHDVDDLCHETGCEIADASWITVEDLLENKSIFESCLDLDKLDAIGIDTTSHHHYQPSEDQPHGTCVFVAQSFEKGTFFSGTVRITEPFDPSKLSLSWTDCNGWRLISGIEYRGEDIEGFDGYSTSGKGMEFGVFRVDKANDDDLDMPLLEGEEIWASQAIDDAAEVELWEGHDLTPWWPSSDKPVRSGRYQVLLGTWPFPSFADYSPKKGWHDPGGRIDNVTSWRGLCEPAE